MGSSHGIMKKFEILGKKLKEYRTSRNESITEVAAALKRDRTHLSKIENGHEKPSIQILNLLIDHFSLTKAESIQLFYLAGYNGRGLVQVSDKNIIELPSRKEDRTMENQEEKNMIKVNIPNNASVLYSDSVFVTTSSYGIVFDFAQVVGLEQNVVSRIGMSKEHAVALLNVLKEKLSGDIK